MIKNVYIRAAGRSPIGAFNGALASQSAVDLGVHVAKSLMGRVPSDTKIDQVVFGNVLSAGLGQAPARQVAIGAGLPESAVCTTVNKVCSSGLKAVIMGVQAVALGDAKTVLAGGMESMSNAPFLLAGATVRRGGGYGEQRVADVILRDGLIDPYSGIHMGVCAEETADEYKISREDQDAYCIRSYERAARAWETGAFRAQVFPLALPASSRSRRPEGGKTATTMVEEDEEYKKIDLARVPQLKPAFRASGGSVTAANSSSINDGAAGVILSSEAGGALARIISYGEAECPPRRFTLAPASAIPIALERAGLSVGQIARWEINEAFSVVALVNMRLLGLDPERVNVLGGGVSLGHPIGSSGCRILVTLVHQLNPGEYGVAAICNGGGGASALVIQRM